MENELDLELDSTKTPENEPAVKATQSKRSPRKKATESKTEAAPIALEVKEDKVPVPEPVSEPISIPAIQVKKKSPLVRPMKRKKAGTSRGRGRRKAI